MIKKKRRVASEASDAPPKRKKAGVASEVSDVTPKKRPARDDRINKGFAKATRGSSGNDEDKKGALADHAVATAVRGQSSSSVIRIVGSCFKSREVPSNFEAYAPCVGDVIRFHPRDSNDEVASLWASGLVEEVNPPDEIGTLAILKYVDCKDSAAGEWGKNFMLGVNAGYSGLVHFCKSKCDGVPTAHQVHTTEWCIEKNPPRARPEEVPLSEDPRRAGKAAGMPMFGVPIPFHDDARMRQIVGWRDRWKGDRKNMLPRAENSRGDGGSPTPIRGDHKKNLEQGLAVAEHPCEERRDRHEHDGHALSAQSMGEACFGEQPFKHVGGKERDAASVKPVHQIIAEKKEIAAAFRQKMRLHEGEKDYRRHKDCESDSSNDSQVFRDAPSVLKSSPSHMLAEMQAGELLRNGVTLMKRQLSSRQGGSCEADSTRSSDLEGLQGGVTADLTLASAPSFAAEEKQLGIGGVREMRTDAESLDAIKAGDVP